MGVALAMSGCDPMTTRCDSTGCVPDDATFPDDELEKASPQCRRFVAWVMAREIKVVVFDMDLTMGAGHCGTGLELADLDSYVDAASPDFVEAATILSRIPGVRLAVATNSDPAEYDLPGQSCETHILGPDLAQHLIRRRCPEALPHFGIMVGFDPELHEDVPRLPGKSVHMRQIAAHYGVPFRNMVLIDDSASRLENTDGWHGVLVRNTSIGFRFEDCFVDDSLPPDLRAAHRHSPEPFGRGEG